jgi:starch phosphorylase
VNGVAKLHGEVSRDMWRGLWPSLLPPEVPIGSVTNGINHRTWVGPDMAAVYTRYLGSGWLDRPAEEQSWRAFDRIPNEELWRAHERGRERLVSFVRARLGAKGRNGNGGDVLNPEALTIGFARRFALYKRATLLFRDPDRLVRLLTNKERPVQVLIAGKAHPKDEPAKGLIRNIMHLLRHPEIAKRIVFLENYDMGVASYLVQGCDVWLNTPRRPQEASGTSGMKSAVNGGLHLSVLDGWWAEAYQPGNGWAIGHAERYASAEEQDAIESELLYSLLEDEVVPTFYDQRRDGVPASWVGMMKRSIPALSRFFNTDRMVGEYAQHAYAPASTRKWELAESGFARARSLAAWRASLAARWEGVAVRAYQSSTGGETHLGETVHIAATVALGGMRADEVHVEALVGAADGHGSVREPRRVPLQQVGQSDGGAEFAGSFVLDTPGTLAFTVRALPCHPDLPTALATGRVAWA